MPCYLGVKSNGDKHKVLQKPEKETSNCMRRPEKDDFTERVTFQLILEVTIGVHHVDEVANNT